MKIAVPVEKDETEPRVGASPETVKKLIALGAEVSVAAGAGAQSLMTDDAFKDAGATIAKTNGDAISGADVILSVRRLGSADLKKAKSGALHLGMLDPFSDGKGIEAMGKAGVNAFAMEFMPRITRAQVMDVLSSQANIAGYQAVIEGAAHYGRALPMMMTAAGTVPAAKVFVMGAGVAGLQAIATARRLGAVVTATDVRAAAGEQVESLGAKFIMHESLKDASGEGGYARELTADEQKAQADLVAGHIAKQDIVITTALIPGRPAPKLVSKAMVENMGPGSVIVDMAVERGGNCDVSKPGEVVDHKGVHIIGHLNLPGRLPSTASNLYARNLYAFLETLVDKDAKALAVNWDDELVAATALTRDGKVVHPTLIKEEA
ncbi:MAG: Re/Si-specific NAD(P)(+) transhydrogenase subunit alpha [Pseudomonadota bacterium]